MPIFFNVHYQGIAVMSMREGISRKVSEAAIRFAMFAVADYWHTYIFPSHFQAGAKRKYRHTKRKKKYSEIKRAFAMGESYTDPRTGRTERHSVVKGGTVDIAFEGNTERKGRANRAIRVSRNGFRMKIIVPKYITMRRRGNYPDMKRELTSTTVEESVVLRRVFWQAYRKFIDANRVVQSERN